MPTPWLGPRGRVAPGWGAGRPAGVRPFRQVGLRPAVAAVDPVGVDVTGQSVDGADAQVKQVRVAGRASSRSAPMSHPHASHTA